MKILKKSIPQVIACLFAFFFWPAFIYGESQTVHLPVTLDYSFLQSSFVRQAFNMPGEKAVPLDLGEGCGGIELWKPEVGPDKDKSMLKLGSNIKVKAGLPIGKTCIKLSEWDGYIEVFQKIVVDQKSMKLGLQTMDFQTMTLDRTRTSIDSVLLDIIKTYLNPYLNKVVVDVDAPVKGLQSLLPLFFQTKDRASAYSWLSSLRVGQVQIKQEGILLDLLMDVEKPRLPEEKPVASPTETEIQNIVKAWEDWDAFSAYQIQALTGQPVTEDEKNNILETILDARYDFIQKLEEEKLTQDLILRQFTGTWQNFGPIMRKYLTKKLSNVPSNFMSFTTVSDALSALQNIGPAIGLNINRDALSKMAQLISVPGLSTDLQYSQTVDNKLRNFFSLGQIEGDPGPSIYVPEIELPDMSHSGYSGHDTCNLFCANYRWPFFSFLFPPAFADSTSIDPEKLRPWIFKKNEFDAYIERASQTLEKANAEIVKKKKLDQKYQTLYRNLLMATAWQETCWRQFVDNKGKVRPIESYNQSSVGLMQINVRVWRGIYQPEALRWNIDYNIRTGCEILELYLQRYALKKAQTRTMDMDTLARTVYAMYNGGPGQYQKFLVRKKDNKFLKVDQLFWQKYLWVKGGQLNKLSVCLIGK